MIEPFAHPAWPEVNQRFAVDAAAGLARLAHWLTRRTKAKARIPVGGE
jgi:hypothetical protein